MAAATTARKESVPKCTDQYLSVPTPLRAFSANTPCSTRRTLSANLLRESSSPLRHQLSKNTTDYIPESTLSSCFPY